MSFIASADYPLGEVPLFELADNEANGNKRRGHIALVPEGGRSADAYFVDEGPFLKFSAQFGGAMTPGTVRELAAELIAWADKKESSTKPIRFACGCVSCGPKCECDGECRAARR